MKHFSHINTAVDITGRYSGRQPFHLFIKDFFRQHKKYGSKDRKQITHLCYCYFRLGQSAKNKPLHQAIIEALFLCSGRANELLAAVKPEWNEKTAISIEEKCALLNIAPGSLNIFPSIGELSNGIDATDFNFSHLIQPDVFIRIRPGYQQPVINKLEKAGIAAVLLYPNCISLPATTKIEELLQVNKEVVIQDFSSQRTGELMKLITPGRSNFKVWDCCAASGGKSIMATDILEDIDLTVSDIRPAVLNNLKKRFNEAGINNYKTLATDLTRPVNNLQKDSFNLIIADVPCTGSGTWGRTPERLLFFDEKEIDSFRQLQKKIVTTVMPCLQKGGYFLYITCSVFKKENEDMADFIQTNLSAELIKMEVLKGYTQRADTMFAAMFRKSI
jgi:16S rRNA (cytosine967-C5)-methyltransferase